MDIGGYEEKFEEILGWQANSFYNGGPEVHRIERESYSLTIHEAQFQEYLFKRNRGYIQVQWHWRGEVPNQIDEDLDLNQDGQVDIQISFSTENKYVDYNSLNDLVLGPLVSNSTLTYLRLADQDDLAQLVYEDWRAVNIMIKRDFLTE